MKRLPSVIAAWVVLGCSPVCVAALPTNDAPQRQIRFATAEEAAARRDKLVRFIWPDGLPTNRQPKVTRDVGAEAFEKHLKEVDRSLAKRVDRLEVDVLGITSLAYLIHPATPSDTPRLAVVHAGHSQLGEYLNVGYVDSIHLFLRRGYRVAMMHMPRCGWNDDETAELPNGKKPAIKSPGTKGHPAIVNLPQQDPSLAPGAGFRPFLEPVVACINHWASTSTGELDVTMVGLSGGGWTTHMAAALDTRIRRSVPVAGSFPLYLRNRDGGSVGDLEQYFSPLYDENVAEDGSGGGVATWLEIYALGGFGEGRRQVMVTAQYDSCCFRGDPEKTVDTFKDIVAGSVRALGRGQWEHRLDTTHRSHMISPWVLEEAVVPILPRKGDRP